MNVILKLIFFVVMGFIFVGDVILLVLQTVSRGVTYLGGLVIGVVIGVWSQITKSIKNVTSWIRKLSNNGSSQTRKLVAASISPFRNVWKSLRGMKLSLPVRKPRAKKLALLKPKKQKKSRRLRIRVKYFLLGALSAAIVTFIVQSYYFINSLPNPKLIGQVNFSVSTQIYDRKGNLLYDLYRDQDRTPVELEELPKHVIDATLAIEDRNFYTHNGISFIGGVLRAIRDTYRTGNLQGGSTITQQLVKTSLLTPERTFERKFKEAILALWAERIFTKNEILEMYLNQVSYGGTAYGIEGASRTYFSKPAKELTLNEAAFLAGLTRAPSTYSPYLNPQISLQRRNEVLKSMQEAGYITEDKYEGEIKQNLHVQPPKTFIRAPHFVFYVKSLLEQTYGIRRVEEGGLRVVTSLDIELQEEIETILQEELEKVQNLNVQNGAVLITSPSTGEILAMVGSKDYFQEPYGAFNVTTARRQPGSSIKPLMYALALESGKFTAASVIQDTPVEYQIPGSRPYRPLNYDNRFHGPVSLRYALANSYNVPAVKVLNEVGVPEFISFARDLGVTTWDTPERYGLSITLGGAEVKLTDMAVAFGTLANYGERVDLNPILSVEDYRGTVLDEFQEPEPTRVLSPQTSFIISDILADNTARQAAFGPNSTLVIPSEKVAVKTGTTNDKRDNWTNGYTRKYFVGVWVGNNDNSPMNPILTSGITGASPIWNRAMNLVLSRNTDIATGINQIPFSIPVDVTSRQCYFSRIEYFKAGTEGEGCNARALSVTPVPTQPPVRNF